MPEPNSFVTSFDSVLKQIDIVFDANDDSSGLAGSHCESQSADSFITFAGTMTDAPPPDEPE